MGKKKQKSEVMLTEPEWQAAFEQQVSEQQAAPKQQTVSRQQTAPKQKKKRWKNIWALGVILSLIGACIMLTRCMKISGIYQTEPSVVELFNVGICNRYNYVLYRDLYNAVNNKRLTFEQLYGAFGEEEQRELTLSDEMISQGRDILGYDETEATLEEVQQFWESVMQESLANVYAYFGECLDNLSRDGIVFDYWMQDRDTGFVVTNTLQTEKGQAFEVEEYAVWFQIQFDAAGNFSVQNAADSDINTLTKTLYDSERKGLYGSFVTGKYDIANYILDTIEPVEDQYVYVGSVAEDSAFTGQLEQRARSYGGPKNCTVIYGIKRSQWEILVGNYHGQHDYWDISREYRYDGLGSIYLTIAAVLLCWGFFYGNPRKEEKGLLRHFRRAPAEVLAVGMAVLFPGMYEEVIRWATRLYMNYNPYYYRRIAGYGWTWGDYLAYGANLLVIAGLFFAAWYIGCCLGEIRKLGVRGYLHKRMICSRVWNWCRGKVRRYYLTLVNLDITQDSRKQVIKLLVINGIVVLVLCTMWVAGWFGVIIYSLLLYFVVKKYISDLQKKYSILLRATNEIADGNLEVRIAEHLGVFEPFKPQIYRIEEGFQKAVAEEVKSQRMKTELITNVSHDLKTPLTAIITYVNLLKEENVTEEQRAQYLQILEQKSLRLKALIEDLFEVSRANSKNVTLNLVDVDIVNLLRQVEFEQEDRLEERHLAVRLRLPEEKVILRLDSQKAYRIYENLFGNIIKYAMEGTRIYVDLEQSGDEVTVRLKNITEQEITVSGEELTERFVRGDASRNTEGSGLGLAIVRSFTELMGGKFSVTVDGDLFTASTTWVREPQNVQ